jgi:predicted amidophosphoribosyltransferase
MDDQGEPFVTACWHCGAPQHQTQSYCSTCGRDPLPARHCEQRKAGASASRVLAGHPSARFDSQSRRWSEAEPGS